MVAKKAWTLVRMEEFGKYTTSKPTVLRSPPVVAQMGRVGTPQNLAQWIGRVCKGEVCCKKGWILNLHINTFSASMAIVAGSWFMGKFLIE